MFKKFLNKLTRKADNAVMAASVALKNRKGRGLCRYQRKDFNSGGFGSAGADDALCTSQNNRYGNRNYKGFRAV